jgi:hypothetical protein
MLEILPPALWLANRFLVGEPADHRRCKLTKKVMPTYSAFFFAYGRYFESHPMTMPEFRAFKDDDLPLPP